MWKYVSRRIRETIEKSVNHFDKRSTTNGIVNAVGDPPEEKNKRSCPPCRWYARRKCWNSYKESNNERRNFYCPNGSWLNAITWSGAVVIGWYTSQLIHLKLKYHSKRNEKYVNNLITFLQPYANCVTNNPAQLPSCSDINDIIKKIAPSVQLISNDKETLETSSSAHTHSGSKSASDEFEDTLNYIENKLGWSAIQNGQPKDGIKLLRSAANRNHAPALYNLALCYEMGIGLIANEKKAMELYRSAARLEHPAALYNLGIYYAQGRGGLKKDVEIATRLLRLAAVQGHQVAINTLQSLDEDVPDPETDSDTWSTYEFSPFSDNVVPPSLTSMFVENLNYSQTPHYAQVVV